jgi:hypothetical protein
MGAFNWSNELAGLRWLEFAVVESGTGRGNGSWEMHTESAFAGAATTEACAVGWRDRLGRRICMGEFEV